MEFTGVYHKTSEQMSYPLNEDELVVNLKTGYDVKRRGGHPWREREVDREEGGDRLQKEAPPSDLVDHHSGSTLQEM